MRFKTKASENILWYKQSATCFNDALPLGNGRMGAMVYGDVLNEKISLNDDTLWSGYPRKNNIEDYPSVYKKAIEMFDRGEKLEAQKYLESKFGDYLNQVYLPLANINLHQKHLGEVKHYRRQLDLRSAVHTVKYVVDGCKFKREAFVSEPFEALVMHLTCEEKNKISFKAELEERYKADISTEKDKIILNGTAPIFLCDYGDMLRSIDYAKYDGQGISYAGVMTVKAKGGKVIYSENCVSVEDADEATIYFTSRTNFESFNVKPKSKEYLAKAKNDLEEAIAQDYLDLKKKSIASHKKLYNKCGISLSDGENSRIPTDERLIRLAKGKEDNALYSLLFNYGKYLTISASRKGTQPLNLQGVWNDKMLPPWSSNYTLNINAEMNYWPTLPCGLFGCYEPFIRMVEELAENGKETAKIFYGVSGWVSHHVTDIWKFTHPSTGRLNNSAQWGFWCMSSGWISVMLWNYYRYTLDKKYLERIYPVINGAAEFYRNLLIECDGKRIFPLSTSPENNYIENGDKLAVDKSTAMTCEIIFDLFTAVDKAQQILGIKGNYGEIIPKLKKPGICKNGELCEWYEEHEVWDAHHRHISHLYGLFPAKIFNEQEKEAAKKVLISRGDEGTGWSLAWKINFWAQLGDGNRALKLLKNQLKIVPVDCEDIGFSGGSYPNLLCAHPPFQIDGNFGATRGIIEMLLQYDENDNPVFLPALPKNWKNGQVKNLCLPGRKTVSFTWKNGKISHSEIKKIKV